MTVSEVRTQAFEGLYQSLGTKEGEKSIYKLAKGRERKTRDLDQVKCIKDEEREFWFKKEILRIDGRSIFTIYLIKDMRSYQTLTG